MTTEKSAADSNQASEQNTTVNKVLQKARNQDQGKGKFELGTLAMVAGPCHPARTLDLSIFKDSKA